MHLSRSGRKHIPAPAAPLLALLALAAVVAGLLVPLSTAGATPPPNPSDAQIQSAAAQKSALTAQVAALGVQVAQLQAELQQLRDKAELAQQKADYAQELLAQARAAAIAAQQAVAAAQRRVVLAQANFARYMQATYVSGGVDGTTGSLLTAQDPSQLLQQSTLEQYQASHQLDAIGAMQTATVGRSNADAAARVAVGKQTQAKAAADAANQTAVAALTAAQQQEQALNATLAGSQTKLQAAQLQLATLNNERATFVAYQKEQARIAAARRAAQLRAEARARAAAAARAAAQQAAAAAAAAHSDSGSSSVSSGGSAGFVSSPAPTPTGGAWTPAKGQAAVARAERYLGIIYAWDGGNASGPTYGVCAGDGAFNDCNVIGFDCSGLSLYAWAPYISLYHYTVVQYGQAGSYHPSPGNFMPGDLLFWSSDGTIGGIHHVAIYIGNGEVIQAPESGEVIQETPWDQVSSGYYGATRPLT